MRILWALALLAPLGSDAASAQTGSAAEIPTVTVVQVDAAANEIQVRETGSMRLRTLELDPSSVIARGSGARMALGELQPGDLIRVQSGAGGGGDVVRAERIQVLAAPRSRTGMPLQEAPADSGGRSPSALAPRTGRPGALGSEAPGGPDLAPGTDAVPGPDATPGPGLAPDPGALGAGAARTPDRGLETGRDPSGRRGTATGRSSGTGRTGAGTSAGGGGSGGAAGGGGP